jgi:hypothetical protein
MLLIRHIGLDDINVSVNAINIINGIVNRWCSAMPGLRKELGIIGSGSRKNKPGILVIGKSSTTGIVLSWSA